MAAVWLILFFGFFLLYLGAELLVRSAVQIAQHYRLSPLVIGLTVVAFSTSAPEAIVSTLAQFRGMSGDVALGNVIGSNIANIGMVLAVYLIIRPCDVTHDIKWKKMPLLIFIYLLMFCVMVGGKVSRAEGAFLLIVLILYVLYQYFFPPGEAKIEEEIKLHDKQEKRPIKITLQFFAVIGSGVLLVFGTKAILNGIINIAEAYGISERVVAVSLVAFGTSLPEFATAIVAAFRKKPEIMVGTVIGSNIFNPLLILPCAAFVRPIKFSDKMLLIDFPLMVGFTILLWILMALGNNRLSRIDGVVLLLAYGSYITYLYT